MTIFKQIRMSVGNTFLNDISDLQKEENARKPITICIFSFSLHYFFIFGKINELKWTKKVFSFIGKSFLTADCEFDRSLWQKIGNQKIISYGFM